MAMRAAVGIVLAALIWTAPAQELKPKPVGLGDQSALMDVYERRAALLLASNAEVLERYRRDVEPIELALLEGGRVRDPMQARVAAWAIVRETETRHLSPQLIASVLREEDPWLVTDTVSYAGAVGWMQVMPQHVYPTHPCGTDLTDGNVSVCYGSEIMREYMGEALDAAIRVALLRYNGCKATPGCEQYAERVLGRINQ